MTPEPVYVRVPNVRGRPSVIPARYLAPAEREQAIARLTTPL